MNQYQLYCILFFFLLSPFFAHSQYNYYWREPNRSEADSLQIILKSTKNDTIKMFLNRQIGLYYQEINRPLALSYYLEQLRLAQKLKQPLWEAEAMSRMGHIKSLQQDYSAALNWLLNANTLASDSETERNIWNARHFTPGGDLHHARMVVVASINHHFGLLYFFANNKTAFIDGGRGALRYFNKALQLSQDLHDKALESMVYAAMGEVYRDVNKLDSGKWALLKALQYCRESGHTRYKGIIHYALGGIFELKADYGRAKKEYDSCVWSGIGTEADDFTGLGYLALTSISLKTEHIDSALINSKKAYALYTSMKDTLGLISSYRALSQVYEQLKQIDSAYYFLKKANAFSAALNIAGRLERFQVFNFDEQIRLQALEAEHAKTQSRIRTGSLIAGISILILISLILFRTNKRHRSDKDKIKKAYDQLKATQSQLIQSEKMASLGELTAGIAHEIQNPLNFVNNFSEINTELIRDLKAEIQNGNFQEVSSIANDIESNEEKINHHGKRADGIVKGMLQHSRTNSGQKELTDINLLCDEYLRLAYHGYRAKDKSFNAKFETDFDSSLPKMNVVPQDIGRVILNLINNAFFTVNEKRAISELTYEPLVTVSTKNLSDKIQIIIKDNGNGIPDAIKEKIFQPFFTTKITGQGTGLGLSLSYDIIKAHGGTIELNSIHEKGSAFIILFPK